MKTHLDCIPCLFKQTLSAVRQAGTDPEKQKEIMCGFAKTLSTLSLDVFPLKIKCPVAAKETGGNIGDVALLYN
jgi:damage-control phosphatase, subfamily I